MTVRAAVYARYSTANQNPLSIEDQVRLCRDRVAGFGGRVVAVYDDPALSGTTMKTRPGLARMLRDAGRGLFEVICVESLDRLSRNLADTAAMHEILSFHEVRIESCEEGAIGFLHVALKGAMGQSYVEAVRAKVRRGLRGMVRRGQGVGKPGYGYRAANRIDENGRPVVGLREIFEPEAVVVRRIFEAYAGGESVARIVRDLNRDKIPGPGGGLWRHGTLYGRRTLGDGIFRRDLYRGRRVYGRRRVIRDPRTGIPRSRPAAPEDVVMVEVPELRIVGDGLWDRVHRRLSAARGYGARESGGNGRSLRGLLRCSECGGAMTRIGPRRIEGKLFSVWRCRSRQETGGGCGNARGVPTDRAVREIVRQLVAWAGGDGDGRVREAVDAWTREREMLVAKINEGRGGIERILDAVQGGKWSRAAWDRMMDIEGEVARCEIRLEDLAPAGADEAEGMCVSKRLEQVLRDAERDDDMEAWLFAGQRLRPFLERVDVVPLPKRGQWRLEVTPSAAGLGRFMTQGEPGDGVDVEPMAGVVWRLSRRRDGKDMVAARL